MSTAASGSFIRQTPASGSNVQTLQQSIPGLENMTGAASGNILDLLNGNVSPSIARNANAYFGAQAGQPATGGAGTFIGNRGADLYNQQSNAAKQQGLGNLLNMIGTYSGNVGTSANQQQQNNQFNQSLGQNAYQFDQTNALNQFNAMINAITNLGSLAKGGSNPFASVTPSFSF